jgi:hypothetical protein
MFTANTMSTIAEAIGMMLPHGVSHPGDRGAAGGIHEYGWTTYGLGWFQQDYRGRAVDFHTGSIDGMVAIHGLIRDERLGVLVLANRDHAELRHALMLDVFDRFTGAPARDWSADLLALYGDLQKEADERRRKEESRRVAGTSPALPLERYAGTYDNPLHGDVIVTHEGGRLRARYGTAFNGALEHWHYDTFRAKWDAAWRGTALLTFAIDADGRPSGLKALGATFTRRQDESPGRPTAARPDAPAARF